MTGPLDLLAVTGAAVAAGLAAGPLVFAGARALAARCGPASRAWIWRMALFGLAAPTAVAAAWALAAPARASGAAKLDAPSAAFLAYAAPEPGLGARLGEMLTDVFAQPGVQIALIGLGALAWLGGAYGVYAWARARGALGRVMAEARKVEAPLVRAQFHAWAARLGVEAPPELLASARAPGPFLTGRRAVVLPPAAIDAAPRALGHVLAHELAHHARGDEIARPLDGALARLGWFNPFVRRAFEALVQAREEACDAMVLAAAPAERRAYAETVLTLAAGRVAPAASAFPNATERACAMRLKAILTPSSDPDRRARPFSLLAGAAVGAFALSSGLGLAACATAAAQEADVEAEAEAEGSATVREGRVVIVRAEEGEEPVTQVFEFSGEGPHEHIVVIGEDGEPIITPPTDGEFTWVERTIEGGAADELVEFEHLDDGAVVVRLRDPATGEVETIDIPAGAGAAHEEHGEHRVVVVRENIEEVIVDGEGDPPHVERRIRIIRNAPDAGDGGGDVEIEVEVETADDDG